MKKFPMDLSKFKKMSVSDSATMLQHPDGHQIKIAHKPLSKDMKDQLDKLPMAGGNTMAKPEKMAYGGYTGPNNPKLDESKKVPPTAKKSISDEQMPASDDEKRFYGEMPYDQPEEPKMAKGGMIPSPKERMASKMMPSSSGPKMMADGGDASGDQPAAPLPIATDPSQVSLPQAYNNTLPEAQSSAPNAQSTPDDDSPLDDSVSSAPSPSSGGNGGSDSNSIPSLSSVYNNPNLPNVQGGYQEQVAGIQQEAKAQQQQARQQEAILKGNLQAQNNIATEYKSHVQALDDERKGLIDDINNNHIDPNRYMGSLSTLGRIQTGVSLFLGGLGGRGNGNVALDLLNKNIDRDIDAQKADLGKRETLLSANLKQYGNLNDATNVTKLMQQDILSNQIQKAAASAGSPLAQARAQQLLGQLQSQTAPAAQQFAIRRMLLSQQDGNGQPGQPQSGSNLRKEDPAIYVPAAVPPEHQKEVYGSITAAQNAKRMAGNILSSFDTSAKENTVLKTGAGLLRTPGSIFALHQAMIPTFADLEGAVRKANMDNTFHNITPAPGDTDYTIAQKRKALVNYLQSKASAPAAKAYGIDLHKFESTNPASGNEKNEAIEQWAKQNPDNPKAARILQSLKQRGQ